MDYLTVLREEHAKRQREQQEAACEFGELLDELCHVLQKIQEVFSSPQVAILMQRVARQEALISAEEQEAVWMDAYIESLQQLPFADVYEDTYVDDLPDSAYGEYDEFGP